MFPPSEGLLPGMEVKIVTKYLKISPKKLRWVVDTIRGKDVLEAVDYLKFMPQRGSPLVIKSLKSAIAAAEYNFNLKKDNLFIKEIFVGQGPSLKRWTQKAFGRAAPILKKTAHLTVILAEIIPSGVKKVKAKKTAKAAYEPVPKEETPTAEIPAETPLSKEEKRAIGEHKKESIFDFRRTAGHRSKQHLDKIRAKGKGGVLKKMFRNKDI